MSVIDFSRADLLAKYGSWVDVQVNFYDFIFMSASERCGKHFNSGVLDEIAAGEFSDGGGLYERTKREIELLFQTQEQAWAAFERASEGDK